MSGDTKLLTAKDRLEQFEKILDEYTGNLGLNKFVYSEEFQIPLNFSMTELQRISSDECEGYSYLLMRYSLFVQQEYNKHVVRKKWAEHHLDSIVAIEADNFGTKFTKYEQRRKMVIKANAFASQLDTMILHAASRLDSLETMADKITLVSNILNRMSYGKRKNS